MNANSKPSTSYIRITWLGQGGFFFVSKDCRLLVDPYISDCIQRIQGLKRLHPFPLQLNSLRPDTLLVTHDHLDHLDPEGVEEIHLRYPACHFAGPARAHDHFRRLNIAEEMLTEIAPDSQTTFGDITVTAVFAAHSDPSACGYVIEANDQRIYLTGDTLFDERLFSPQTTDVDLLLICINGKLGNMNADEALRCIERLRPRMALPMHYGLFAENTADPAPFIEACRHLGVSSFPMTIGKEFTL